MKTIKRSAIIVILLFVILSANAFAGTNLGGKQKRIVGSFSGVSVSSGIDLYLTQGVAEEVVVEADEDIINNIITRVEDGVLRIYVKESHHLFNWNWNEKRKVYVTFKDLKLIDASAGSDVYGQGTIKLERVRIEASSGSDLELALTAQDVEIHTSSGSDATVRGTCATLDASASSGSDLDASGLHSKKCRVSASSGSDASVYASEELDADASSGSDIYYSGNPAQKNINESSGGDVTRR
jgi:hypothetical protein